jgi:hypothetical protein
MVQHNTHTFDMVSLVSIALISGNYFLSPYKQDIIQFGKRVCSYLTGVSNHNRSGEEVLRPLDDEYGTKVINGFFHTIKSSGIFHNDTLCGLGKSTYWTDTYKKNQKGIFKHGKLHGPGTQRIYEMNFGIQTTVAGMFYKSLLHGKGSITNTIGFQLKGTFDHGRLLKGTIRVPSVIYSRTYYGIIQKISGIFNSDTVFDINDSTSIPLYSLNGKGTIAHNDGSTYKGTFKKSSLHGGPGVITTNTSVLECDNFKHGTPHGTGSVVTDDYEIRGELSMGRFRSKYVYTNRKTNQIIKYNPINNRLQLTFPNGDEMITAYTGVVERKLSCGVSRVYNILNNYPSCSLTHDVWACGVEHLIQTTSFENVRYTLNSSMDTLDNRQFMLWLKSVDETLYKCIGESNLKGFITGALYMKFQVPDDFDLPHVNNNVLQKLLSIKNTLVSDGQEIVLITTETIRS